MIDDMYQPIIIRNSILADHISVFESHLKKTTKPGTAETYSRSLRCFLSFVIQDRKFKFRVSDIERYASYLSQTKKFQESSIATYITALRKFCKFLVDCKILQRNPAKQVHVSSTSNKSEVSFFHHFELTLLIDSIDSTTVHGLRDIAMILTMLGCSCSEHELSKATLENIIKIDGSFYLHIPKRKGQGLHRVVIPAPAAEALQAYLNARNLSNDMPLFHSNSNRTKGAPISVRGMREAFNRRLKISGISIERRKSLTASSLRNTSGAILSASGKNSDDIMKQLRISSQFTVQKYMNLAEEAKSAGLHHAIGYLE